MPHNLIFDYPLHDYPRITPLKLCNTWHDFLTFHYYDHNSTAILNLQATKNYLSRSRYKDYRDTKIVSDRDEDLMNWGFFQTRRHIISPNLIAFACL